MSNTPIELVLNRLPEHRPEGRGWVANCPAHGGDSFKLRIDEAEDGKVLLACRSQNCSPSDIVAAIKLDMQDLFPSENGSGSIPKPAPKPQTIKKPQPVDKDFKPTKQYDYPDAAGNLRLVVFRIETSSPDGTRKKTFKQAHPDAGGVLCLGQGEGELPLYRLPEVLAARNSGKTIFLVEGEKDADNLRGIGLAATCNPMGAGKWRPEYTEHLAGAALVVIIPDNDTAGEKHALKVAPLLVKAGIPVKVLALPDLPEKADASDWVEAGGTADKLVQLAAETSLWKPAGEKKEQAELTDMGNARRLVQLHGNDLRYCYAWSQWFVWDGNRWRRDETGEVYRRAKAAARSIYLEAAESEDEDRQKALAKHAFKTQGAERLKAMMFLAQSEPDIPVRVAEWNTPPWLLCCPNGTVDLQTGEIAPSRPENLITKVTGAAYDTSAAAPVWEAFLERVLPDADVRAFVQRAIGYGLSADVSEQVLFFLYGSGSNGKSTLLGAIMNALGDYAMQAAADLLIQKESTGGPNNDIAELFAARFVATIEVEDGKRMAESLVKQITGGDRIKARFMRQDFFEFEPTHKIYLAANHRPVIRGNDYAIWRRIRVIPFDVQIPDEEKDPTLPEKLRAELPGILAWAVRGCMEWRRIGLKPPAKVLSATDEYREDMDTLGDFIKDSCILKPALEVTAADIYAAYLKWCEENSDRPLGKKNFGTRLREQKGVKTGDHIGPKEARGWFGIALLDPGARSVPDVPGKSDTNSHISYREITSYGVDRENLYETSGTSGNGPSPPVEEKEEGEVGMEEFRP
jgi:putative DNA primase/helicase